MRAPQLWTNATCGYLQLPVARSGAAFTYDSTDGYALLFGGRGSSGLLNDTWTYANHSWRDLTATLPSAPPAREGASVAYDSVNHYFVLFGGRSTTRTFGDTWEFTNGRWTNVTAASTYAPTARVGASLAYDRKTEYLVLFGGRQGGLTLSETWKFANGNWSHLFPGTHPSARSNATLLYVANLFVPAGLLLFGGLNVTGAPTNDTWEYQAGAWRDVSALSGPPPAARSDAAAADDLLDNQVVLFGGVDRSGGVLSDTWRFNASGWARLATSSAAAGLAGSSMAYFVTSTRATTDGYVLLEGGRTAGGALSSACWKFGALSTTATVGPADVGQNDSVSALAIRGVPPYQYHWTFGDGTASNLAQSNHSYLVPGPFLANVTATDQIGVVSLVGVHVQISPALVLNATTNRSQTDVGIAVNFTARASGGLTPYRLSWSFSQGNSSSLPSAPHAFVTAGVQRGIAVLTDANNFTVTRAANVSVHPLLQAVPALNSTGLIVVGQTVAFRANVSGGTTPYRVDWNVDGTNTSTGLVLNYTFPFTGPHLVLVYVRDLAGASTVGRLNLSVVGTPPSASAPKSGFWTPTHVVEAGVGLMLVVIFVVALVVRARRPSSDSAPSSPSRGNAGAARPGSGPVGGPPARPPSGGARPAGSPGVRPPTPRPAAPSPSRPGGPPPRTGASGSSGSVPTDPLFTWTPLTPPPATAVRSSSPPPTPRPQPIRPAPPDPAFRVTVPPARSPATALPRTMAVLNSQPPPLVGSAAPPTGASPSTPLPPNDPVQRPKRPIP